MLLFLACAVEKTEPTDDTATVGTEDQRTTLDGTITWAVDFGADSEAKGMADCTYTRTYSGAEDRSAPWLCPDCETVFQLDVEITDGRDCYDLISDTDPVEVEYLGWDDAEWYRGAGSWLSARGPVTLAGDEVTVSQSVSAEEAEADWAFEITGTLTLGTEEGDPYRGYYPPESYACGWPKADPPAYEGDYVATEGSTLPDGVFHDVCEEPVRLHDFAGSWLVVDISAMDCGPCQSMAGDEEAFLEELRGEGYDVQVITMLAPSLSDTGGTPTTAELQDWIDSFGIDSPVLADRVWGLSTVGLQMPDDFGYPAIVVADPDLTVTYVQIGYSTFDEIADVIRGG